HAGYPIVSLAGDLEPEPAHAAAIAALRARGDAVIDGRVARWIALPGATIATVPGAGAAARLVAGDDGCSWRAEDVAKLYAELSAHAGMRIVASAEAPRADRGEPAGELALATAARLFDVHVHGPTDPAPSPPRAGHREGGAAALSPGSADATPRLPHAHAPSAGVLAIRGDAWTWRPVVEQSR